MNIILIYDVNKKRVSKVLKICRKYLIRVQNSVFEGYITEAKFVSLQKELKSVIDPNYDSICIYIIKNLKYIDKQEIGSLRESNFII